MHTIKQFLHQLRIGKRHVRKGVLLFVVLFCILIIIDGLLLYGIHQYFPNIWKEDNSSTSSIPVMAENTSQSAITKAIDRIEINSDYAILIDMEDQKTLYEKKAEERIYPASLTKVLTAITALDLKDNMKEEGEVNQSDIGFLLEEGASVAGLQPGDVISYEQALYALILPSGADAADFLANHLGGSIEKFVADMNTKAQALGMQNTHFMNTTGLHDDEHYTTLQDMKKMMMHAWKNPVFRNVMTTLHYSINDLASHPNGLDVKSTLLLYKDSLTFSGGEIIGGKTGYTPEAGRCLISVARMEDNHLYMLITAKAEGAQDTHMNDALHVYETIANVVEGTEAK